MLPDLFVVIHSHKSVSNLCSMFIAQRIVRIDRARKDNRTGSYSEIDVILAALNKQALPFIVSRHGTHRDFAPETNNIQPGWSKNMQFDARSSLFC